MHVPRKVFSLEMLCTRALLPRTHGHIVKENLHSTYGSCVHVIRNASSGNLKKDFDLVVIGGGSGGLACAKEAAELGKDVAVLDYVSPSPKGTKWGLGGTCVNVGCIPKKLMHQAAIVGHHVKESKAYGWSSQDATCDWATLANNVGDHVRSLNWGHRVALVDKEVVYMNAKGKLLDKNTVLTVDKKNKEVKLEAGNIVIATGMRPKLMNDVPGMKEAAITSDDIFWMEKPPGKTLVVGGSYVALECAGFLRGIGFDTTVMVRSIPLRGFDQQMAGYVLGNMQQQGVKVLVGSTPKSVEKISDNEYKVYWKDGSDVYNTILLAIGRDPQTAGLGLPEAGVKMDEENGFIIGGYKGDIERTSVDNIYAIGDVLKDGPQLTPVAIKAGKMLARRLFGGSILQMDYDKVPTTVFTPLEYSCVGLSEEQAEIKYGKDNIEVYHAFYKPLEFYLPKTPHEECYIKVICMADEPHTIVGIHLTGPSSGEVMQGFAVALRCGLTIEQLQSTVGIHPTIAEELVKIHVTKRSGLDPTVSGC